MFVSGILLYVDMPKFQAVADNIRLRCKCHGVSGSCEVKTCWRNVPSMRHVGTLLLDKYDIATQVSKNCSLVYRGVKFHEILLARKFHGISVKYQRFDKNDHIVNY